MTVLLLEWQNGVAQERRDRKADLPEGSVTQPTKAWPHGASTLGHLHGNDGDQEDIPGVY